MELLNYTGKPIGLVNKIGNPYKVFQSAGRARIESVDEETKEIDLITIYERKYGKVLGLPDPDLNKQKMYIVSKEIAERAVKGRFDLLVADDPMSFDGSIYYRKLINY